MKKLELDINLMKKGKLMHDKKKLIFFRKPTNSKNSFSKLFTFLMIGSAIIFALILIFSSKVNLTIVAIFLSVETTFLITGIFILIKNKYHISEEEKNKSKPSEVVLPKAYYNIVSSLNKLSKQNDLLYFEYTLLPILRNLISDKFRFKYNKNIQNTNYEELLNEKLVTLIKEKYPYRDGFLGYSTHNFDIKSEITEILNKIETI